MKHILILGAGISGLGAAEVLLQKKECVLISDRHSITADCRKLLEDQGAFFATGIQSPHLLEGIDEVVVSPSVSADNAVVQSALKRGIPVIGEIELAYRMAVAPILAVTGTNGKTTTTTLLGNMMQEDEKTYAVAGNIGVSLVKESQKVDKDGWIIAEISSFQLEFVKTFKPKGATVLNITPDHLDRHHSMDAYVAAKARIFENMDAEGIVLLNGEDSYTESLAKKANTHTRVGFFSTERESKEGAFLKNGMLMLRINGEEKAICALSELQVHGNPNYENALAASFLAYTAGVSLPAIGRALKRYKGLPHRLEKVRELNGVMYYNDSKATNTDAAVKGMSSFSSPVVLIAGGYDKGTDLSQFMRSVKKHVKQLVLMGEASERFAENAKRFGIESVSLAKNMKEAVEKARQAADSGDVILLSPACSSFDLYMNYQDRGNDFKRIVNGLE